MVCLQPINFEGKYFLLFVVSPSLSAWLFLSISVYVWTPQNKCPSQEELSLLILHVIGKEEREESHKRIIGCVECERKNKADDSSSFGKKKRPCVYGFSTFTKLISFSIYPSIIQPKRTHFLHHPKSFNGTFYVVVSLYLNKSESSYFRLKIIAKQIDYFHKTTTKYWHRHNK